MTAATPQVGESPTAPFFGGPAPPAPSAVARIRPIAPPVRDAGSCPADPTRMIARTNG
jgi:hypothetical protein